MDNRGRIVALLITCVLFSWAKSGTLNEPITTAWTGKSVDLDCGDCVACTHIETPYIRRAWIRGDPVNDPSSVVKITGDDRIKLVNNSRILRINDVKESDEGDYWCTTSTTMREYRQPLKLRVIVSGFLCAPPEVVIDGGFKRERTSIIELYFSNDKIEYFCRIGYELVGVPTRVCNATLGGWSSEAPHCEPKYITDLRRKLDSLEVTVTNNVNVMTDFGNRLSTLERRDFSNAPDVFHDHSFEQHLKGDVSDDLNQENVSHYVQFEWTIENVEKAIAQLRGTELKYLESKPFYTSFPGYRLKLYLHQIDKMPDHFGISLGLVRGKFDNQIPWPFTKNYKLRFGDKIDRFFTPSEETACPARYNRPSSTTTLPCTGYDNQTKVELGGLDFPLGDRSIKIKAIIRLN